MVIPALRLYPFKAEEFIRFAVIFRDFMFSRKLLEIVLPEIIGEIHIKHRLHFPGIPTRIYHPGNPVFHFDRIDPVTHATGFFQR